jgi:cytochrome P450
MLEIVSVMGDNEHVTMTEISKLKYLLGAIKESLRLYPATSTLTREANEDFKVGDYDFKKGTKVTLALQGIHFDERYWPDPFKFDPARHTTETNVEDPAQFFKWWPFSLKERNCIGMNFALLELRIVLALMFKNFEFRPDRLRPPVPGTKFTTYPTNGLNVFIKRRKQQ